MPFLGTIVNFFAVLVCGLLGMLVKRGVPKRISDALVSAMARQVANGNTSASTSRLTSVRVFPVSPTSVRTWTVSSAETICK